MKSVNQRRLTAGLVTLLLHIIFLGVLYYLRLERKEREQRREEVVLIDLGNVAQAGGVEEPEGLAEEGSQEPTPPQTSSQPQPIPPTPQPEPKPIPQPKPTVQPTRTQTHQESLRIKEAAQAEAKLKAQREAEARRRAEEQAQAEAEKRSQVGSSVANAFGAGKGKATNQGNAAGTGNQGEINGVANGSFSLSGRSIISNGGQLATPKTNKGIEGKVVISIEVNAQGQVTQASVSPRGTNIADPSIRAEAIRAARSTAFNAQEGADTQRGTITYIYVLRR